MFENSFWCSFDPLWILTNAITVEVRLVYFAYWFEFDLFFQFPSVLLIAISMFFASVIFPSEYSTEILLYLLFWGAMIGSTLAIIFKLVFYINIGTIFIINVSFLPLLFLQIWQRVCRLSKIERIECGSYTPVVVRKCVSLLIYL